MGLRTGGWRSPGVEESAKKDKTNVLLERNEGFHHPITQGGDRN